jgi:hypothetical protein
LNDLDSPPRKPGSGGGDGLDLQEMRLRRASPRPDGRDAYIQLRRHVCSRLAPLLDELDSPTEVADARTWVIEHLNNMLVEDRIVLKQFERGRLIEDVLSDLLGAAPEEE